MNKFDTSRLEALPERALALVSQARDGVWRAVPDGAEKWLQTGVAIGAMKKGGRVAGSFVRRNPVAVVAVATAVTAAGVLWLLARRQTRRVGNGTAKGRSTRVEATRNKGKTGASRTAAPRTSRRAKATTQ